MGRVIVIPAFSDNYIYLYQYSRDKAFAVDPADSSAVLAVLAENNLALTMILSTHCHHDHVGANLELKKATGCEVVGADSRRVPGIDCVVHDGDIISAGPVQIQIITTPGHTDKDVCYYLPDGMDNPGGVVFTGDTLFVAGCGRRFGTDALTMFNSLKKLSLLPPDTRVYCGHDYTVEDYEFALTVEPGNDTTRQLLQKAKQTSAQGKLTVPSTIEQEKLTNPFLRADTPQIRQTLDMLKSPSHEIFAELRRRKDFF
ncbi:MAG: hydroxyacylglutathione hydrolase [Planctomycetota bacterium]|jgi:hydroxyacylglutathione hydrolase